MSTAETWGSPAVGAGRQNWQAADRLLTWVFMGWKEPARPGRWVILTAVGAGLVAAVVVPGSPRVGVNLLVCALAVAVAVFVLARREGRRRGRARPVGWVASAFGGLAVGLAAVAALRACEWLSVGCAMAGFCLGAAAVLRARRWDAVLLCVPVFAVAALRSASWVVRPMRVVNLRSRALPWLHGAGIGLVLTIVVGSLLAAADPVFAAALQAVSSAFVLDAIVVRVGAFLVAAFTVLAAAFAVSARPAWSPISPSRSAAADVDAVTGIDLDSPQASQPAEWLTPLVLVAGTIAAFLSVEATRLFGGASVVRESTLTHAERAREGFGQLTVVTLIVMALISWAGRRATRGKAASTPSGAGSARDRRLMTSAGGVLLALTLLLAASALRRLWLYQQAYGWTVTRLNAGVFELWIALLLAGISTAWLLRRTDLLPRFVIGSAGLGLLIVALAGPDAIVADANVTRFEQTGKIDAGYLSTLSADAVPALNRLPEPQRSCALAGHRNERDPWFGWNLSRHRAAQILHGHPAAMVNSPAAASACPAEAGTGD